MNAAPPIESDHPWRDVRLTAARAAAFALGAFAAINLLGSFWRARFDANLWWLDVRFLPTWLGGSLTGLIATLLIAWALRPVAVRWRRRSTVLIVLLTGSIATGNAVHFFVLLARGTIHAGVPVPLSLFIAMGLIWLATEVAHSPRAIDGHTIRRPHRRRHAFVALITFALLGIGFPLEQMFFFGKTDYRRKADAVVVFGARVYSDGALSVALADRVRTACTLYHQGLAPLLIMSGGPGDADIHETEAMRDMALSLGVPDNAVLLDPAGVNTGATARNTTRIFRENNIRRVLAVSHFYHLPRVKLAFQRQGVDVFTVPAKESYTLTAMPIYMGREVAAMWWYWI